MSRRWCLYGMKQCDRLDLAKIFGWVYGCLDRTESPTCVADSDALRCRIKAPSWCPQEKQP